MNYKPTEVILCKYGEVILKGTNRGTFENQMLRDVRRRARMIGNFNIRVNQSTVYVEPKDAEAEDNIGRMYDQIGKVFGFAGICIARVCEKNLESILETAKEYLPSRMVGVKTFKCESKRSDKHFPLSSPELSGEVGAAVLEAIPGITVDLHNPDVIVRIEVRDEYAYIHAGQDKGAGGMPQGSAGRGMLLLSGGIDSPVAGYMMMKRGLTIECVHFESFPYTSEAAREKVLQLASQLTEFSGKIKVHVISLTHIQEVLRDTCEEEYFTLLLRRFMMTLACKCASDNNCLAVITGESLGQVASQTLRALSVTDVMADRLVFRPLIGMDKDEIIKISRKIGTFETSILPYDDCCTVFTPRHPRTQPELEKVMAEEAKIDFDGLVAEAYATRNTVVLNQEI